MPEPARSSTAVHSWVTPPCWARRRLAGCRSPAPRPAGGAGDAAGPGAGALPGPPFELEEVTVADLQAGLSSGRYTARRWSSSTSTGSRPWTGPDVSLHAIIETNPDALTRAEELDRERATNGPRGPLHGVPVLLKDNIDTPDRMTTTAGSLALEGSIPPRDSHVAERLRAAGAILLGQGQPERVGQHPLRPLDAAAGAARGGQCRNPYVLDRNAVRLELGLGGGGVGQLRRGGGRHRDRRVDRLPGVGQRRGRDQADGRAGRAGRASSRSRTPRTPPGRSAGRWPTRPRCSARWRARTRATPATRRPAAVDDRLHRRPRPDGLRGPGSGWRGPSSSATATRRRPLAEAAIGVAAGARRRSWWTRPTFPTPASYDDAELDVLLYEFKADLDAYLATLGPPARGPHAGRRDRVQRARRATGDAVLRPGALRPGRGQGAAHATRRIGRRCASAAGSPHARARRGAGDSTASTRWWRRPAIPAWPTDPVNGDHFTGSSSTPGGGGGLPQRERADGIRVGAAGQSVVHRHGVERADADPAGVCVRADNHASESAEVACLRSLDSPPGGWWIFHPGTRLLQPGSACPSPALSLSDPAARAGLSREQLLELYYWMRLTRDARGAAGQSVPPDQGRRRALSLARPGSRARSAAPTRSGARTCSRRSSATSARCW